MYEGFNLIGPAFLRQDTPIVTGLPVNEVLITIYNAPGEMSPWGYSMVISPGYNQNSFVYLRDTGTGPLFEIGTGAPEPC